MTPMTATLLSKLRSANRAESNDAATAIISLFDAMKSNDTTMKWLIDELGKGGIVEALIDLTDKHEAANMALCNLSWSAENRNRIARANGIPALLRVVRHVRNPNSKSNAMNALANMAMSHSEEIASAGGIETMMDMLGSDEFVFREDAASAINSLAAGSDNVRLSIGRLGGVAALVRLLEAGDETCVEVKATAALCNLMFESPENKTALEAAGGIPVLVRLLASDNTKIQEHVASALLNVAGNDAPASRNSAIVAAGGILALEALASATDNPDVRQATKSVLYKLANVDDTAISHKAQAAFARLTPSPKTPQPKI